MGWLPTFGIARTLLVPCCLLLLAPPLHAQDRGGIAGGGAGYYSISGAESGAGYQFEAAANINRVRSEIQYRLFLSYADFRGDEDVPECDITEVFSCLAEPRRHTHISIGWAPVFQVGPGSVLRARLAPIGAGAFVRLTETRRETRPNCERFQGGECPMGEQVQLVSHPETEIGYGFRSGIELGLHVRPLVVQLGARWQHSFGGAAAYFAVPISVGYFF